MVIPTLNERDHIEPLVELLDTVLDTVNWEAIFVDDDSPDGTAERFREIGRRDRRVRCLQRIGQRGLTTACIEGALATSARYIAVMDADMQHDETDAGDIEKQAGRSGGREPVYGRGRNRQMGYRARI